MPMSQEAWSMPENKRKKVGDKECVFQHCQCYLCRTIMDENRRLKKAEAEWMRLTEMLASAAYRLMQLAGGAEVECGDVGFACKDGHFYEEIAFCRIKALVELKKAVEWDQKHGGTIA